MTSQAAEMVGLSHTSALFLSLQWPLQAFEVFFVFSPYILWVMESALCNNSN